MATITPIPVQNNRATRRCQEHIRSRRKQYVHLGRITRTMAPDHDHTIHNGTCPRMGHPTFPCPTCNGGLGPGQCQGDLGCNNGIRCTGDCHW